MKPITLGKIYAAGGLVSWLLLDWLAKIIPLEMFSLVFYCIIGQFRCYFSAKREGVMPVNMRENTEKSNQEESPLWKELKNRQFLFLRFSSVYSFDITCLRVFFCSSFIKRSFGLLNIFEERAPSNELWHLSYSKPAWGCGWQGKKSTDILFSFSLLSFIQTLVGRSKAARI